MLLGVATAVIVQTIRHQGEGAQVGNQAASIAAHLAAPSPGGDPAATMSGPRLDPVVVDRWAQEAAHLTSVSVALDERAFERWLPRIERIERALDADELPASQLTQLRQVHARLVETGVVPPRPLAASADHGT